MDGWNPKINRRKEPRFRVVWPATLTCHAGDREQSVEAKVCEISINGARLQLRSLTIGPHHIVIESESLRLTLKVSLAAAAFCAPVEIAWYGAGREKNSFEVGVMFLQSGDESRAAIKKLLPEVALESTRPQC
ncbi:MAG: PilZ domain-containing protein [Syntrophobacteraceae bacterium]|nr:PilZ domain-containing protein [Syntrophobacteraceae bacterium]